jgi:hypothetical protein
MQHMILLDDCNAFLAAESGHSPSKEYEPVGRDILFGEPRNCF